MADDTFDWDEVLVTRDPVQKEVQVSFVAVDSEGSPGGGSGGSLCPPGTFKHYDDSLLKDGNFEVVTQPNTRIAAADYPAAIDADFFVYVSREEARPFDEYVNVSFEPREGSGFPWTVDTLPEPVKVLIPKGQVDGKLKVTMPAAAKRSESPELYPDNDDVGLYYLFDMVIDSPACDSRSLILNSPCTEDTYVLPVVETQGRRPFLLLIETCDDEFPEGDGGVVAGPPVGGDNPECEPHDCDALLTTSGSGSIAYFLRPNTEPVIQFASGNVLANFEGGPSSWTIGDQDYNPINTAQGVAVDGRSSKPCAINLSAATPRTFTGDVLEGNADFGVYAVREGDIRPTERGYGDYSAGASMWAYIDCTGPSSATCSFDIFGGLDIGVTTLNSLATDTSALAGKTEVNVSQGYIRIYGVGAQAGVVLFEAPITAASATGWYGITVSGGFTTRVSPVNSAFDELEGQWTVGITTPVGGTSAIQNTLLTGIQTTAFLYRDPLAGKGYKKLIINNRGGDPAIYGICNGQPTPGFGRHLVDYTPPAYCERIP